MYLGVLSLETMHIHIKWIIQSLGPSSASVQPTLPLNSTKRPEMPCIWARSNMVVDQDHFQLLHSPLIPKFGWNCQLLANIFCQPRQTASLEGSQQSMRWAMQYGPGHWARGLLPVLFDTSVWTCYPFWRHQHTEPDLATASCAAALNKWISRHSLP